VQPAPLHNGNGGNNGGGNGSGGGGGGDIYTRAVRDGKRIISWYWLETCIRERRLVGRCRLTPVFHSRPHACFQRLKLKHDELLSNFACFGFNCNLRHYSLVPLNNSPLWVPPPTLEAWRLTQNTCFFSLTSAEIQLKSSLTSA